MTRILARATIPPEFHRKPVLSKSRRQKSQMTGKPLNIDRLRIATPCPMSWEQMAGDDRVRFCDHCQLNVYNISELTQIEAEALVASIEGRLCARLFRRTDGTVLTKDCPVGLRALRRRVAKRTAAIFAAVLTLTSAALGQQSADREKSDVHTAITRTNIPDQTGTLLVFTVTDVQGAVIPDAKISIKDLRTDEITNAATNAEGGFEISSLPEGTYSIAIASPGFTSYTAGKLVIEKGTRTSVNVVLEVGALLGDVIVVEPASKTKNR